MFYPKDFKSYKIKNKISKFLKKRLSGRREHFQFRKGLKVLLRNMISQNSS